MKAFRLLQCFGEIRDEFLEEAISEEPAKKRQTFSRRLRYVAAGLCAAMVFCAGLAVYTQVHSRTDLVNPPLHTGQVTSAVEDSVQIPSPFQECNTLEEAETLAGFSLTVPDTFEAYRNRIIQVQAESMIEVFYWDAEEVEGLRIRKAVGTDEISGDYNIYEIDKTELINGVSVHLRGNGNLFYAAEWTDGTYAYSITSDIGISMDTLEVLLAEIQ